MSCGVVQNFLRGVVRVHNDSVLSDQKMTVTVTEKEAPQVHTYIYTYIYVIVQKSKSSGDAKIKK